MAYSSMEEQDINELKAWWKDNGKTIIVSLIVALAAVFGWRYWQQYQINQMHITSGQFEQVLYDYQKDPKAAGKELDQFIQDNQKTGYATFALLNKAKLAVDAKDFTQAENALKEAITQAPDDILSSISALRLAELQLDQKQFDAALESLNLVKDNSWASRKTMLTGDIQLAKGDKEAAKASYQQALQGASALEQQWLQVRLNNL
ncbi:YfgM family protein [Pasteurellaceae bacterium LIM206]|nr:YfgM family protein [Pasteurellaceae bacterium LIM206]